MYLSECDDQRFLHQLTSWKSLFFSTACLFIVFSGQQRHKKNIDRAQQVVLAVVRFDHDGRILITRDGTLPCHKLTVKHNRRVSEQNQPFHNES